MIIVMGHFEIHGGDRAAAADLMRAMMAETVKEAGCVHYAFATDLTEPNRFQLGELWQDDAALAAPFQMPHMATFRGGLAKLRVLKRAVKKYTVANIEDL